MDAAPLVRLLRAWLAGERPLPAVDPRVADAARAHRLEGTLHHIGAPLAGVDHGQLAAAWTENLGAHLRRVSVLQTVWPTQAPPPLILKGADFAEHIFDDPGARRASDLDLLLPDPHFEPVLAALRLQADASRLPRQEAFDGDLPYEVGLRFGEVMLELHRAPHPIHRARLGGAELWRRGVPARLGSLPVRAPEPFDRILLWLANQAKQSFHGDLADLLDLALALRRLPGPTPWSTLRHRAEDAGLGRPLRLALRRLARSGMWPGALPALPRLDDRVLGWLVPEPAQGAGEVDPVVFQLVKLWLAEGPARAAIASRGAATALRRARRGLGRRLLGRPPGVGV